EQRMTFIDLMPSTELPSTYGMFEEGYDVFGDGSLIAVDLTGHAIGQFGVFVHLQSNQIVFLCADAVWLSKTYRDLIFPSKISNLLTRDAKSYRHNIKKLYNLFIVHPCLNLIPCVLTMGWKNF
ncbi:hypothetical protein ACT453_31940, partial [Bacillus sp. D-CC]